MAAKSLSDFFETFYYSGPRPAVMVRYQGHQNRDIDRQIGRNLHKVIIRVAHGPYAPAMHALASAWQIDPANPRAPSYAWLKATMLAPNPPPLTYGQITTLVTRIRKEFEEFLWRQCPALCAGSRHARHAAIERCHRQKLDRQRTRRLKKFKEREYRLFAEFRK